MTKRMRLENRAISDYVVKIQVVKCRSGNKNEIIKKILIGLLKDESIELVCSDEEYIYVRYKKND